MNEPETATTSSMTTIFGMNVSVISWTWVSAWMQRDDDAHEHRGADRGPGGDDDGPDRLLDDVEGVPLVHG